MLIDFFDNRDTFCLFVVVFFSAFLSFSAVLIQVGEESAKRKHVATAPIFCCPGSFFFNLFCLWTQYDKLLCMGIGVHRKSEA